MHFLHGDVAGVALAHGGADHADDALQPIPQEAFGNPKRRVQGQFVHGGVQYWLWVTDPIYERRYLALPNGTRHLGECCLTISLGEPFEGYAYKLIAAIMERAQIETT